MNILESFNIHLNNKEAISIVGAGGKTTTMFRLAEILKSNNMKVLITTTTAIFTPEKGAYDLLEIGQLGLDSRNLKSGTITVLGSSISKENKLIGVEGKYIDYIFSKGYFDFILVEADGSKRKPIKAPASHEPVIPSMTTKVIGVIGLDSIGKEINEENVHRPEYFCSVTGGHLGEIIDEIIITKLITHKDGLFKSCPNNSEKYLLLNKADAEDRQTSGDIIKYLLNKSGFLLNAIIISSMIGEI